MFTLSEFKSQAADMDFQRTNMFSAVFATTPSSKTSELLSTFGGELYNNMGLDGNWLGLTPGEFNQGITSIVTAGTRQVVRKSGVNKFLIGAMTERVVQSLLGEFTVGTYLIDFFNMAFPTSGLMIYSAKIPENRLSYEMDKFHNAPNIRITGRDLEPLVLSFRMDSEASNYRAMQDWVNAVEDPITGLRALPQDVEADIQVNLHARNGLPHTVIMFSGCVPVGCGAPEFTYDGDNTIAVFDVTFAYRSMQTGSVGKQAAMDWLEDKTVQQIETINPEQSLSGQAARMSRLGGAGGGISRITTSTSRII
ncbi:baseplate protein [Klebsiella phage Metamorpho]|nr:baseplate protein [Klebsiella phage Metamorpho]